MFDPPQEACTSPMGTGTLFCSSRAKKKHTADQSGTVAGAALCQATGSAKCGSGAGLMACATVSMRMVSWAAVLISLAESAARSTCSSMLD